MTSVGFLKVLEITSTVGGLAMFALLICCQDSKASFASFRPVTFFLLSSSPSLQISSISSYAIGSLDKPMTEW